jgi:glucokinase
VRVTRQLLAASSRRSVLSDRIELSSADVLATADHGDALALEALSEVGRALGIVMSACAAILNPARFVIGGGLGLAGFDFIVPAIREEMMRRTIPNCRGALDIVPSRVASSAIGSACLVWYAASGKMVKS